MEEKPCDKKPSEASFIGNALLGSTGVKDYNDQADDILAETLGQDLDQAAEKKKKSEEAKKVE